jgi:beta-glucosidase
LGQDRSVFLIPSRNLISGSHSLGGRDDPINEAGIKYYSDVIDLLLSKRIEPYVTIFHWDLPSALEERYGGWTNFEEITKDFARYSRVLFERFGDRVKNWITLNEVRRGCVVAPVARRG